MSTDVDECVRGSHSCTDESEACFNVAGSYNCGCQWGYVFDADKQKCVQNEAIAIAKAVVDRNIAAREQEEPGKSPDTDMPTFTILIPEVKSTSLV